ncbi:hypothetical protein IG631_03047 [Alternaria alternata]|nr:hypothetical protein IG631_03047 [Alternaria alternata]
MTDKHASVEGYSRVQPSCNQWRDTHVPEQSTPTYHVPHILTCRSCRSLLLVAGCGSALSCRRARLVLHRVLQS